MDAMPSPQGSNVTQILGQLPALESSFSEETAKKAALLQMQQQIADSQRSQDTEGLGMTFGPLPGGLARPLGQMAFGAVAPGLATEAGASIAHALKATDPKQLGLSLMSLPLLLGMAAANKGKPPINMAQQFERFSPHQAMAEKYAESVIKRLPNVTDTAFNYEGLLNHIADVPEAGLPAAIKTYIKDDLTSRQRRESGRGVLRRTHGSIDDPNAGQLQSKETFTQQSPYDMLAVKDVDGWNKFDLSDRASAQAFKGDVLSEIGRTAKHPSRTLKAMNQQVASEMTDEFVAMYNKLKIKEDPKFAPIKTNFAMRNKIASLLDGYFDEGRSPRQLRLESQHRALEVPGMSLSPKAEAQVANYELAYKAPLVQTKAIFKLVTGNMSKMSSDEFMAVLDVGARRTASKVIDWAKRRTPGGNLKQ